MTDTNDWNTQIIEEFRANDGKVGGNFAGAPLLLLHTTGARSGKERINPMMYQDLGGPLAVFASNAGADNNPDWYHNVSADPHVTAEIGTSTRSFRARTATSDEREPIWIKQKQDYPGFAGYEAATTAKSRSSSSTRHDPTKFAPDYRPAQASAPSSAHRGETQ